MLGVEMVVVTVGTTATIAFNNFQNFSLRMIAKGRLDPWVITPKPVQIFG
jgi:hypothetical protein